MLRLNLAKVEPSLRSNLKPVSVVQTGLFSEYIIAKIGNVLPVTAEGEKFGENIGF